MHVPASKGSKVSQHMIESGYLQLFRWEMVCVLVLFFVYNK